MINREKVNESEKYLRTGYEQRDGDYHWVEVGIGLRERFVPNLRLEKRPFPSGSRACECELPLRERNDHAGETGREGCCSNRGDSGRF